MGSQALSDPGLLKQLFLEASAHVTALEHLPRDYTSEFARLYVATVARKQDILEQLEFAQRAIDGSANVSRAGVGPPVQWRGHVGAGMSSQEADHVARGEPGVDSALRFDHVKVSDSTFCEQTMQDEAGPQHRAQTNS